MYQHILLAADFSEHGKEVSQKAQKLTDLSQAQLSLIHVVDNFSISDAAYGPVIPFEIDFTDELVETAANRLAELGEQLGVPKTRQWIEMGNPKLEIVRIAEENSIDLIVLGSHGRSGFSMLLGSTAYDVIRHAACDVLAVRLTDD